MSGPVIAKVSIGPSSAGMGIELRFAFPPTGETVYLPLPDRRPFEAACRKAGICLARVIPGVARLNVPRDRAATALRTLSNNGQDLVELLAQLDTERFFDLENAFKRAWPTWETANWDDPDSLIPVVEVHCHGDTFPLEMLPLFDFGELPAVRNDDDLARVAARFLGFTAVVWRVVDTPLPGDHILRNVPRLPVQFLRHRKLPSAAEEGRFLVTLNRYVQVEGPWPVSEDEDAVRDTLVRALYDGGALDGGPASNPPVQVHHFACHCDTSTELDDDYSLRLSSKDGRRREISFGQLREAYRPRLRTDRGRERSRGVIVLNACASSRTNPLTAFSLPRWFLARGHRAFIGTETDVPDGVAAGFAAALYGRLLEHRRPLGEAVVWARRDLLRDFHNPLGLLYVMYGDTYLTVEEARPGAYRGLNR